MRPLPPGGLGVPSGFEEFNQGPPAVQEVAPEEDQVRVDRPPYAMGFGEAVREAVTAVLFTVSV